jgi:two-component system sensor histidine kinase BaeS
VVTNLLSNALKFTPPGGTVTIRTVQTGSGPGGARQAGAGLAGSGLAGSGAVLEVTDTGVGIPADELPRIFDRFWRGQAAAQTSGSGIGLAIAAELAWAHGGTLTAASEPGAGTRLTLTVPG